MLYLILESAVRSFGLAFAVWAVLRVFRIKSLQIQSLAWTSVLLCALSMPFLMRVMESLVTAAPAAATAWIPPAPSSPSFPRIVMAAPEVSSSTNWAAIGFAIYAVIAGAFFFRLFVGLWRSFRICRTAVRLTETWNRGEDVRVTDGLRLPATIGTTILFPRDWESWNTFERTSILAHENLHVRRRDFHIRTLAGLHRVIFWFSPFAWWLEHHLMELSERICDDAAIRNTEDRISYAEILVRLAGRSSRDEFFGVAMARGKTVTRRVERILRETKVGPEMSLTGRVLTLVALFPVVVFASSGWLVAKAAPIAAVLVRQQPPQPAQPQTQTPSPSPRQPAQPTTAPVQAEQPREAAQYLAAWPEQEVPYIISADERSAFEKLRTDEEREMFIEMFWRRRDPNPSTTDNEFRDEYYRRIVLANQQYTTRTSAPGWKTDRGRALIKLGEPDEIEKHPGGTTYARDPREGVGRVATLPFERWRYRFVDGIGNNVILEFVDMNSSGDYRLQFDPREGPNNVLGPNR